LLGNSKRLSGWLVDRVGEITFDKFVSRLSELVRKLV